MTAPQLPSDIPARASWLKVAGTAWLALVSAITIVTRAEVSRLVAEGGATAQDPRVPSLAARVSDLERRADTAARQPKLVAQADLDTVRQALEGRLARLEEAQASAPEGDDIRALLARVSALEARKAPPPAVPRKAPASAKPVTQAKPQPPAPPFSVVGLERRGDERFVSILPVGQRQLADVQLLREGESTGTWLLQAIDGRSAVFVVDGQSQRIAIP